MLLTSACQSSLPSSTTSSKSGPLFPTQLKATNCNVKADMMVLPFEEAMEEADLVAKLSIDHVVKELVSPSHKTLFQASVIDVVKGEKELTTIHVLQGGTSKCSYNENKLFLPGEQYYLILNNATQGGLEQTYYIQGEETGMYKVIEDDYIVKLAYRASELSYIDNASLVSKLQANYDKQIMVFEEQAFVDKISSLIEENNALERKLSIDEFNEMNDIIKKVNSGELPVAALKDAEVLIKRNSYYVKPDILKAYNELAQ